MKITKILLLTLASVVLSLSHSHAQESIITPAPNISVWGDATLDVGQGVALYIDAPELEQARLVNATELTGIRFKEVKNEQN